MAGLGTITGMVGHVSKVAEGTCLKVASVIEQIGLISADSVAPVAQGGTHTLHAGIGTGGAYSLC